MKRIKINPTIELLCYINIVVFYISDVLYHIWAKNNLDLVRPTLIIKSAFLIVLVVVIIKTYDALQDKTILIVLGCLGFLYVLEKVVFQKEIITSNIVFLGRYLYIMPLLLVYNSFLKEKVKVKKAIDIIEYIFIFNGLLMIVAFLFELSFFKRYGSNRFGYTGFFPRDSISYLSCLMTLYYYTLLSKNKVVLRVLLFVGSILIGLLTGTKSYYLFLFLFVIWILVNKDNKKINVLILLVSSLLIFGTSSIFNNVISLFIDVHRDHGLINSISSFRFQLLSDIVLNNTFSENLKLFIIGGINYNDIRRPEMEMFDVLFYVGIFGLLLMYYFYYKYLFKKFFCSENKFIILSFIIIGFFASNFFHNINLSLWLLLFLGYFYNEKKVNL